MTPTQAQELVGLLEAFYEPMAKPKARAYAAKLEALDYEAAARAVERCTDELRFLPAWSEIAERLPGGPAQAATEAEAAWQAVRRSVTSGPRLPYSTACGSPPSGADLDPRTLTAAQSVGLRRIESAVHGDDPDALGYAKRDFLDAWRCEADADRAGLLTPGRVDAQQQLGAGPVRLALGQGGPVALLGDGSDPPPVLSAEEIAANARRLSGLLGEALATSPPSQQVEPSERPSIRGRYERALTAAAEVPEEVRAQDAAQQETQRERFRRWQREHEARQAAGREAAA